jgi:hypothetical protein
MNWLPDMDLNHDKQIQSLLCYRYTIGQASVLKLVKFLLWSQDMPQEYRLILKNADSRVTRRTWSAICATAATSR